MHTYVNNGKENVGREISHFSPVAVFFFFLRVQLCENVVCHGLSQCYITPALWVTAKTLQEW